MDELRVDLGQRSYPIFIDRNLFPNAGQLLKGILAAGKIMVITNPTVGQLYLNDLVEGLRQGGFEAFSAEVPDGEQYKTLDSASGLYDSLLDHQMDRASAILALGGGVIGDLAGFAAATYKRGISLVQVPTTLLAQVDASVGGKVAVDHPRGKNLIGAFHQPRCVIISLAVLETLPDRELRAGLAEVIKYGVIGDEELFAYLEDNLETLLEGDLETLRFVVKRSCRIKASVVARDERETGLRATLNFGHTLGHAIEAAAGYRSYRHGEAVAVGMVLAARIAVKLRMTTEQLPSRITDLLKRAGLPTRQKEFSADELIEFLRHDKKTLNGRIRFVLPEKIGQVQIVDEVSEETIREILKEQMT